MKSVPSWWCLQAILVMTLLTWTGPAVAAWEPHVPPRVVHVLPLLWPPSLRAADLNKKLHFEANDAEAALTIKVGTTKTGLLLAQIVSRAYGLKDVETRVECGPCPLSSLVTNIEEIAKDAIKQYSNEYMARKKGDVPPNKIGMIQWPATYHVFSMLKDLHATDSRFSPVLPKSCENLRKEVCEEFRRCAQQEGADAGCWQNPARQLASTYEAVLGAEVMERQVMVHLWLPGDRAHQPRLVEASQPCGISTEECALETVPVALQEALKKALKQLPKPPLEPSRLGIGLAWASAGLGLAVTLTLFGLQLASPEQLPLVQADAQRCDFTDERAALGAGVGCRLRLWPAGIGAAVATLGATAVTSWITVRFAQQRRVFHSYTVERSNP